MENTQKDLFLLGGKLVLWFSYFKKSDRPLNDDFSNSLVKEVEFDSAEEFWGIYQYMKRPTSMQRGSDFYIFKEGIKPIWEDRENLGGGRWMISLRKEKRYEWNIIWEEALIGFIRSCHSNKEVTGIVLSVKFNEINISIWFNKEGVKDHESGKEFCENLTNKIEARFWTFKKFPRIDNLI